VIGDLAETIGVRSEREESFLSGLGETPGLLAGGFESQEGRVGGLLSGDVLAGAFAQLAARLGDVEDVVNDLKGEAKVFSKGGQGLKLLFGGIGAHGPESQAGYDHRGGFAFVDETEFGPGGLFAFRFEVGDLSGDEGPATGGEGEFLEKVADLISRCFGSGREDGKRLGEEGVSRQHSNAFAKDLVRGGATPAEIVVVHAGEIIMDERISMDAFDGAGDRKGKTGGAAARFRRRKGEDGAEAFPSGENAVPHGSMEGGRLGLGRREESAQGGLYGFSLAFQVGGKLHTWLSKSKS